MSDAGFVQTLTGFDAGLRAQHITTFGLVTCATTDDAASVLASYPDFDAVPVKERGRIIGVLQRGQRPAPGSARQKMRPIDDSILLSGDAPLMNTVVLLERPPFYRLVVHHESIAGIVTRSDLIRLPVRALSFMMVTALEAMMMAAIASHGSAASDWEQYLPMNRREKLRKSMASFKQQNREPPPLELTSLQDKCGILAKLVPVLPSAFEAEMSEVVKLRNSVAHMRDYAGTRRAMTDFGRRFRLARKWLQALPDDLNDDQAPDDHRG